MLVLWCLLYGHHKELFNLLINPLSHNFALRWHRDDVRENATEEEEEKALKIWQHGVSLNHIFDSVQLIFFLLRFNGTRTFAHNT